MTVKANDSHHLSIFRLIKPRPVCAHLHLLRPLICHLFTDANCSRLHVHEGVLHGANPDLIGKVLSFINTLLKLHALKAVVTDGNAWQDQTGFRHVQSC